MDQQYLAPMVKALHRRGPDDSGNRIHQGRSARMGAAMMGPDYSQWHGMYEVADSFYNHLLPQLEELARRVAGGDERASAAARLMERITAVRESADHRWRLGER